jgi:hypothetical protein
MSDLLDRLAEVHRPAKKRDTFAVVEQYLVQCPACDRNTWQVWRDGDPAYACDLWREYQEQVTRRSDRGGDKQTS